MTVLRPLLQEEEGEYENSEEDKKDEDMEDRQKEEENKDEEEDNDEEIQHHSPSSEYLGKTANKRWKITSQELNYNDEVKGFKNTFTTIIFYQVIMYGKKVWKKAGRKGGKRAHSNRIIQSDSVLH